MNFYTPTRYDERIIRLAVGIEPRTAIGRQRLQAGVDVRWELFPRPVHEWRRWRPGETLTGFLPRFTRHHSGRFARRYDEGVSTPMELRIVDEKGRRFVPRRIRLDVMSEAVVAAAEGPPPPPGAANLRRTFAVDLFPGAAADLPSDATMIRGIVRRTVAGTPQPVRWARVVALAENGDELGWAHGDDRGEFILVVGTPTGNPTIAADPIRVSLRVSAAPASAPDPADPVRATVDPLWDLPIEAIDPLTSALGDRQLSGRIALSGHALVAPAEPAGLIDLPHGRTRSLVVRIA